MVFHTYKHLCELIRSVTNVNIIDVGPLHRL